MGSPLRAAAGYYACRIIRIPSLQALAVTEKAIPLLDPLQVADLVALDQGRGDVYARFVDVFLAGAEARIAALNAHADAGDAQGLAVAAHALMGSAGNVGAARLAALLGRIEAAAKGKDAFSANRLLTALGGEYSAARVALLASSQRG